MQQLSIESGHRGPAVVKIFRLFSDVYFMKKYIVIALCLALLAGASIVLSQISVGHGLDDDPVKLEDAIIIHGIRMESDTPPADPDDEGDGKIIYDDSFTNTIIDYDTIKKGEDRREGKGLGAYEELRKQDRRWHLVTYTIRAHDNIWKIARRFGVHQHVIIGVNGITNPDMVRVGKKIKVPSRAGIYYRVKKGDTLSTVARRHGIGMDKIASQNRIRGDMIRIGQRLFLPGVTPPRVSSATTLARKGEGEARVVSTNTRFRWPLRGRITSGFGNRRDPISGKRSFHCGVDISANVGTAVRASAEGRVIFSGWKDGYGKVVILRHDGGYITVYAHNSKNLVDADATVKRGAVIAHSGMTGAVTGAHLHFEIRKYVNPLNPMRLLK